jgi:hypothetical protein
MRVDATTIASIRFMTIDLCRLSRDAAGDRQQTEEEADEHRGGAVEDELLVVGAARPWSGSRR